MQASDLLQVLDPGLQQQDVLLQLMDFVCASPPAFQLILQHLLGLHQHPVVLLQLLIYETQVSTQRSLVCCFQRPAERQMSPTSTLALYSSILCSCSRYLPTSLSSLSAFMALSLRASSSSRYVRAARASTSSREFCSQTKMHLQLLSLNFSSNASLYAGGLRLKSTIIICH